MKIRHITKIMLLLALCFVCPVIACFIPPTITSPEDDASFHAGVKYTNICTATGDPTISWSGAGTFYPSTGATVSWTAPAADGNTTITAENSCGNDQVTVSVTFDRAFVVEDSNGDPVAIFDNYGNIFLAGTLTEQTPPTATANDEFRIQDSNSNDLMIIDTTNGNMYLDKIVYEDVGSIAAYSGGNDFIIKNSDGDVVAYIPYGGETPGLVKIAGWVYENSL